MSREPRMGIPPERVVQVQNYQPIPTREQETQAAQKLRTIIMQDLRKRYQFVSNEQYTFSMNGLKAIEWDHESTFDEFVSQIAQCLIVSGINPSGRLHRAVDSCGYELQLEVALWRQRNSRSYTSCPKQYLQRLALDYIEKRIGRAGVRAAQLVINKRYSWTRTVSGAIALYHLVIWNADIWIDDWHRVMEDDHVGFDVMAKYSLPGKCFYFHTCGN